MADPALVTSISALVASATTGLAQILTAGKRGDLEERVKRLEGQASGLRVDLDATAARVSKIAEGRTPTGQQPAIREPMPSGVEREWERLLGRVDALEDWRTVREAAEREIERWRTTVERRLDGAERGAVRAREQWIRFTTKVGIILGARSGGRGILADVMEDDRGSEG